MNPSTKREIREWLKVFAYVAGAMFALWFICLRMIAHTPFGIGPSIPYHLFSAEYGYIVSPGGSNRLLIRVHDAGAMHSGYHHVWLLRELPLGMRSIACTGYIQSPDEPIDVFWYDENHCDITLYRTSRPADSEQIVIPYSFR